MTQCNIGIVDAQKQISALQFMNTPNLCIWKKTTWCKYVRIGQTDYHFIMHRCIVNMSPSGVSHSRVKGLITLCSLRVFRHQLRPLLIESNQASALTGNDPHTTLGTSDMLTDCEVYSLIALTCLFDSKFLSTHGVCLPNLIYPDCSFDRTYKWCTGQSISKHWLIQCSTTYSRHACLPMQR